MVYELYAIVGPLAVLRQGSGRYGEARVVPLSEDLGLIPVTPALMHEVGTNPPGGAGLPAAEQWVLDSAVVAWMDSNRPDPSTLALPPFVVLTPPAAAWIAEMSAGGAVAYVEDECFGGDCEQVAALWTDGEVTLGPLVAELDYFSTLDDLLAAPVHRVLRELGVDRGAHFDEFQALDLGRHRRTEEWIEAEDDTGASGPQE